MKRANNLNKKIADIRETLISMGKFLSENELPSPKKTPTESNTSAYSEDSPCKFIPSSESWEELWRAEKHQNAWLESQLSEQERKFYEISRQLNQKVDEVSRENGELKSEIYTLRDANSIYEAQIKDLKKLCASQEEEISKVTNDFNEIVLKENRAYYDVEELKEEVDFLNQSNSAKSQENARLLNVLTMKDKDIENLIQEKLKIARNGEAMRIKLDESTAQLEHMKRRTRSRIRSCEESPMKSKTVIDSLMEVTETKNTTELYSLVSKMWGSPDLKLCLKIRKMIAKFMDTDNVDFRDIWKWLKNTLKDYMKIKKAQSHKYLTSQRHGKNKRSFNLV